MFGLGITEVIALLVIALLVIGPKQLPEMARNLGRFFNELKRTTNMFKDEFTSSMSDQVRPPPYRPPPQPPVSEDTQPVIDPIAVENQQLVFEIPQHEPGPDFYHGEVPTYERDEAAKLALKKKEQGTDDQS